MLSAENNYQKKKKKKKDGDGGEYERFYESDDDADDGPYRFWKFLHPLVLGVDECGVVRSLTPMQIRAIFLLNL